MMKKKITLGVLFGSREFFPASLVVTSFVLSIKLSEYLNKK